MQSNTLFLAAKGADDFTVDQMPIRNQIMGVIRQQYNLMGADQIETPIFEQTSFLQRKYGDDQKLIFDLKTSNSSAEQCSLRYDLTVPLTRFCLNKGIVKGRFYQFGYSFRMDTPNLTQGRRRQFMQADLDIVGEPSNKILDAQLLAAGNNILLKLMIDQYRIYVNNRDIMIQSLRNIGVSADLILTTCSSIDKLDKITTEQCKCELTGKFNGNSELAEKVIGSINNPSKPLKVWFVELQKYCLTLGISPDKLVLNPGLARGMDYYNDLIFEFVLTDSDVKFGTIIAGGRYDGLASMLGSTTVMPMLGLSVGVERVFRYLSVKKIAVTNSKNALIKLFLARINKDITSDKVADQLEQYQLKVNSLIIQNVVNSNTKLITSNIARSISKQLKFALKNDYNYLFVVGKQEMDSNKLTVKNLKTRETQLIELAELPAFVSDMSM